MRGFVFVVLAFAATLVASPAGAAQKLQVPGVGTVPYERLFSEVSEPGETVSAFVLKVAPRFAAYTRETGYEACAVIATDGTRFGVVVGSNRSQISCVLVGAMPEGMHSTGESIHSHPEVARISLTDTDRAFLKIPVSVPTYSTDPDEFSQKDGAGYLVATSTGRVLYQARAGARARWVGRITDTSK